MRRPGDQVLLRHVWRGHIASALPMTVVEETDDHVVAFLAQGTPIRWIDGAPLPVWVDKGCGTIAKTWDDTNRLFVWPRGRAHAMSFMWEAATGNELCFYVDALEPWRETATGWDTFDQELDIWAWPDLSAWFWKDEDRFQERLERGMHTPEEGVAVRAELERVAAELEARAGIWAHAARWRSFRPDPTWPIPSLPEDWDVL